MAATERQFLISHLVFLVLAYRGSAETCSPKVKFLSPVIEDATLSVMENTVLNVKFWLHYDSCQDEHFPVAVRKEDRDSYACSFRLYRNGSCNGTGACCCDTPKKEIIFTRTVSTSDIGTWLWLTKTNSDKIEEALFLDITSDPPQKTSPPTSSTVVSTTAVSPRSEESTVDPPQKTSPRTSSTVVSTTAVSPRSEESTGMVTSTTTPEITPTNHHEEDKQISSWITAGAAAIVAAVAVCYAACHYCGSSSESAALKSQSMVFDMSRYPSEFESQTELLPRGRPARSEECVMIPNFLYAGSASVPDIPHYEDPRLRRLPIFDINNRPPAPLPGKAALESDYAEVDEKQEMESDGYQACASANDYVPIKEIQARKIQVEEAARSAAGSEASPSEEAGDQASGHDKDKQTRL